MLVQLKVFGQQQFNICFNFMVLWTFKSSKAVSMLTLLKRCCFHGQIEFWDCFSILAFFVHSNCSYLNNNRIRGIEKSSAPGLNWRAALILGEL